MMANQDDNLQTPKADEQTGRPRFAKPAAAALAGIALLGAVGGWAVGAKSDETSLVTPLPPTSISALQPSSAIAVKGAVDDIFGDKAVISDATGRALVEFGPEASNPVVAKAETVQVQGRFENGSLHATLLIHADGRRVELGPHPLGVLDRGKERLGLLPQPDVAALTAMVQSAGYSDVRIAGRGPRHLEVVARGADGKDRNLHVDFDGRIRPADLF